MTFFQWRRIGSRRNLRRFWRLLNHHHHLSTLTSLFRDNAASRVTTKLLIVATSLSCIQIKMENDYRYEGLFCCRLSLPKAEVVNANPNSSKSVAHGLKGLSTIYLSLEAKLEITWFLLLLFCQLFWIVNKLTQI